MLTGVLVTLLQLCLILGVWGITGAALLRPAMHHSRGILNPWLFSAFSLMSGCLVSIGIVFTLGILGLLTPLLVLASHGVLLVLGGWFAWPLFKKPARPSPITFIELLLVLACLVLVAMLAWQPPGSWDDTSFHLPMARFYLEQEAIILHEYLRFPLFPQNINLLMVLGLVVGDTTTAQAFVTLPWFLILLCMMGTSLWLMGNTGWGILAAILVAVSSPLKSILGYAYVEMGLAMFCWGGSLALAMTVNKTTPEPARYYWAFWAGLLLGAAAGSKFFGGVYAAILTVCLLIFNRNLRVFALFAAGGLITGIWWYTRSFLISGDPLHPAGGPYFGYFLWSPEDLQHQVNEQHTHGVEPVLTNFWPALTTAKVGFWVLIIPGLFLRQLPTAIRLMQVSVIGYFFFWFFVTQVARYLAPIAAPATFLVIYSLYRGFGFLNDHLPSLTRVFNQRSGLPFLLLLVLIAGAAVEKRRNQIWEDKLARVSGYALFQEANKVRNTYGDRLVQVGFENAIYFYEGTAIGDWFGKGRYSEFVNCSPGPCQLPPALELKNTLQQFDSRLLLISKKFASGFNADDYRPLFEILLEDEIAILLALNVDQPASQSVPTDY